MAEVVDNVWKHNYIKIMHKKQSTIKINSNVLCSYWSQKVKISKF